MKRLVLLLLLLLSTPLFATTVTGVVVDANGNPYASGTFVIDFVNAAGCPAPTLSGSPFQTQFTGQLDSSGNLPTLNLADNNAVCTGSQWRFSICNSTRVSCFNVLITITGSSQSVSAAITAGSIPLASNTLPLKTVWTASTAALASENMPKGATPTAPVDGDRWYDTTQSTEFTFLNGQAIAIDGPISVQTSNIAQATANVSTDQNLLFNQIGNGALAPLNRVGKTLTISSAGTYNLGAASVETFKAKLCTVSGCGSGTVITLATWVTASQATTSVTLGWNFLLNCTTVTQGGAGTMECHGTLNFDSGATLAAASSSFNDSNIAAVTGMPLNTTTLFLQTTIAFGTANAANTALARQQIITLAN